MISSEVNADKPARPGRAHTGHAPVVRRLPAAGPQTGSQTALQTGTQTGRRGSVTARLGRWFLEALEALALFSPAGPVFPLLAEADAPPAGAGPAHTTVEEAGAA